MSISPVSPTSTIKQNSTTHIIRCKWTGVQLAVMQLEQDVLASCSSQAWRMAWTQTAAEHPYFSLTPLNCLRSARQLFRDVLKADSIQLQLNEPAKAQAAQVAFVAVLRNMGVLLRKEPTGAGAALPAAPALPYILPRMETVYTHCQQLLGLAYWYAQAQSPKFQFPRLNLAKINQNTELSDIGAYLTICQQQKDLWLEAEKTRAINVIMEEPEDGDYTNALRKANRTAALVTLGMRKQASRQLLWNWLMAAIQADSAAAYAKFAAQDKAYFQEMFLAPKSKWKNYTLDEIDSLEDVLLRFGPLGSVAYKAFREELASMQAHIRAQTAAFRIDWSAFTVTHDGAMAASAVRVTDAAGNTKKMQAETEAAAEQATLAASPEPQEADYPRKADWLIARARWALARIKVAEADKAAARSKII